MFNRNQYTYQIAEDAVERILKDAASPIKQIGDFIPDEAKILDIGAGNGVLGRVLSALKKRVVIDGIEPNEFAAEIASPYYREIYRGYASEYLHQIKAGEYDYIILADVVEHTEDPSRFLKEIVNCVGSNTKIIVSLPNVAFGGLRLNLLNGLFNYVDSGLLEKTHLRFFTLASAKSLFSSICLACHSIVFLERSFYRVEFSRKSLRASFFQIIRLTFIREARTYQYLFLLSKTLGGSTVECYYGSGPLTIIIDSIFYRPCFKKAALFIIKLRSKIFH